MEINNKYHHFHLKELLENFNHSFKDINNMIVKN